VEQALSRGYFVGVPLGRWYPELADCLLVCVTEKRTRTEIDGLAEVIAGARPASRSKEVARHA
jgi:glycine dehydrogenase subunit 1